MKWLDTALEEHGGLWFRDSYGKALMRFDHTLCYLWHKWQAGEQSSDVDVWMTFKCNLAIDYRAALQWQYGELMKVARFGSALAEAILWRLMYAICGLANKGIDLPMSLSKPMDNGKSSIVWNDTLQKAKDVIAKRFLPMKLFEVIFVVFHKSLPLI